MRPPRLLPTARVYVFEEGDVWDDLAVWLRARGPFVISVLALSYDPEDDALYVAVEE